MTTTVTTIILNQGMNINNDEDTTAITQFYEKTGIRRKISSTGTWYK